MLIVRMFPVYVNSTNSLVTDARFSRSKLAISQTWQIISTVSGRRFDLVKQLRLRLANPLETNLTVSAAVRTQSRQCSTTHPRRCRLWMRSRVQWAAWPSGWWRTAVSSGLKPGSSRSCAAVQKCVTQQQQHSVLSVLQQRPRRWLGGCRCCPVAVTIAV